MMYWYGDHMNGWGYALGIFGAVLFWGLLIAAVVVLVRYLSRGRRESAPPRQSTAEQMLAERFARGEIDADEFRQRMDILRAHHRP